MLSVFVKWQGRALEVQLPLEPPPTVALLKRALAEATQVPESRQKLLGAKPSTFADDSLLSALTLPKGGLMLMGQPEASVAALDASAAHAPPVLDDLDVGLHDVPVDLCEQPDNVAKLAKRVAAAKHVALNAPRAGKHLLVLDIDYTLFDHRSTAETPQELARPHLHEFLAAAYAFYDIVIWSATNMKWVEVKMRELGVTTNQNYRITALVDHASMVTVGPLPKYGVFDCKPLGYLWAVYGEWYHKGNTIMFDDLGRNFVLNPQNGLKIRPFRQAHVSRATDHELERLTHYLLAIADLRDFGELNHSRWERYLERRARE